VRELQNAMERVAVLAPGPSIDAPLVRGMLPAASDDAHGDEPSDLRLDPALASFERRLILRALQASHDNKAEAARLLGVSERTLWYKLKRHRL
jgi:two-component system response regulator AtoC